MMLQGNMRQFFYGLLFVLGAALGVVPVARADLQIDITKGVTDPIPIGASCDRRSKVRIGAPIGLAWFTA